MLSSVLLLGLSFAVQREGKPAELPMHGSGALPTLAFEVEPGVSGKFLIDSGARLSSISPGFAKRRKTDARQLRLSAGNRTIATIKPEVEAVPVRLEDEIDGVLGCDFLSQIVLGVDPHSGVATLWPSGTKESALRAWTTKTSARFRSEIPLSLRDGLPNLPLRLGDQEVLALMDTGTSTTVLSNDALPLVPHFRLRKVEINRWDGPHPASLVLISGYRVNGIENRFPSVVVPDESTGDDAILGFDALSQGPWLLDLKRRRLRLGESARGAVSPLPQIPGIDFVQTESRLVVKVGEGSGLPPGTYRVVSLNGRSVDEAQKLLADSRIPGLSMQQEVDLRGAFLLSVIDEGLNLVVEVAGGKTASLRLGGPSGPIPPPPGVAEPGHVWKFDRQKGWIQIRLSDLE